MQKRSPLSLAVVLAAFAALLLGCNSIGRATGNRDGDPGAKCNTNGDCKTGLICQILGGSGFGAAGTCVGALVVTTPAPANPCANGVKDGDETDIDCGGAVCGKCPVTKTCGGANDCASAVCATSACAPAPSCTDNVKNNTESDRDCGGGACAACSDSRSCTANSDCVSNQCENGVCTSCKDGAKNATETDVDCGGTTCGKCDPGKACTAATDCKNGECVGNVCRDATCTDGIKNGTESGIDCGGSQCAACVAGQACTVNSDCWNNDCVANKCSNDTVVKVGNLPGAIPFDVTGDGSRLVTLGGANATELSINRADFLKTVARYLWVSNSAEGTVSKVDTNPPFAEVRYCTAPGCISDPSRAIVSLDGDAAVANRANYYYGGVVHPERAGATKLAADISRCVDRNGNGRIDTNTTPGPITSASPWFWPLGQANSPDECVIWHTPLTRDRNNNLVGGAGTLPRAAVFDAIQSPTGDLSSNVYIGLYGSQELVQLDGKTGVIKQQISLPNNYTYGAVTERKGFIWVRGGVLHKIKVDPALAVGSQMSIAATYGDSPCAYGIAADIRGYIYEASGTCVARFNPENPGAGWETVNYNAAPGACFGRGLTSDANLQIWSSDTCAGLVRIDASRPFGMGMTYVGAVSPRGRTDSYYLGAGTDGNGYPWLISEGCGNLSANGGCSISDNKFGVVYRVNPTNITQFDAVPVGKNPYCYSDVTGGVLALTANAGGVYRKIFRAACGPKATYKTLNVNADLPQGATQMPATTDTTSIAVRYRAAASLAAMNSAPFIVGGDIPVPAMPININVPMGTDTSFFQVEFTIRSTSATLKPILHDYSISYNCPDQ